MEKATLNKSSINLSRQKLIIYIVLVAVTFAVYWQVNKFDFVNCDDNIYVTDNSNIQAGVTINGLHWAFGTIYGNNFWYPLLWLSFMLDYQLYGLNAGGYHLTNLILHILSTLLLFWLFDRMTKEIWPSAFVAAFFALHPLHVESVAWISERKDVLSAFFWMLTLCLYVYYTEKPAIKRYLPVLFSFVLALMSKPMVITLPVVMILLDYWPLRRFEPQKSNLLFWQLKEKIPFVILSAAVVIITLLAQHDPNANHFPFNSRLFNAPVSFATYLAKTFWPHDLAVFYPFKESLPLWQVTGSTLLILITSITVIMMIKRMPYLFVGWFWYAITIAPVLGIIQSGDHAMADRFHYLPSIGISIMTAWGISFLIKNKNIGKKILLSAAFSFFVILSLLTWKQCGYWENSTKLWNHALKVTKDNFMAHGNLGAALFTEGKISAALEHFNKALQLKPDYLLLYNNRGGAYAELGQYQSAFADFNKAILMNPDYAPSYNCRGIVFSKVGQYQKAIEDFNISIRLNPHEAHTYNYRGTAYTQLGQYQLAMNDLYKAISINPDYLSSYITIAAINGKLNQYNNVVINLSQAIRLQPDNALFYYNRGFAYVKIGQYNNAINDFNKAINLKEDYADAYNNRAAVYLNTGNIESGCRDAKKACELGNCVTLKEVSIKGLCR